MKTTGVVVVCLALVLAFASVSAAQIGTDWRITGLTTPPGMQVTSLSLQLDLGKRLHFKVFGTAELDIGPFPVYGSGFVTSDNILAIIFTLVDTEVELSVELGQPVLVGTIRLFSYDGQFADTDGTATLVNVY